MFTIKHVLLMAVVIPPLIAAPAFPRRIPPAMKTGDLNVKWIHGSADCKSSTDPAIQVHKFDSNTYILRQSKCLNFEGPFLYLLFGDKKALLLDSGAAPVAGKMLPIREVVNGLMAKWQTEHRKAKVELIVAHSHGHTDHWSGDRQFEGRPNTTVVKPELAAVQTFFGFTDWPNDTKVLDLGGRALTVIPTPGHQKTHLAFHDSRTGILLTGDMLYPGLLTVDDWPAYRASVNRLATFAESHKVSYILGAHIEMMAEPRKMYPLGSTFQPNEHVLQLEPRHLAELRAAVEALGDHPKHDEHDEFIIHPRNVQ